MPAANVTALQALVELKLALCNFAAQAKEALSSLAMEIRRALDWLDDQHKHWQAAVKEAEDEVFQAKQELARKKMMRIGDRPPDATEQEQALKKAQFRSQHAEEKLEATRRWLRQLPEAILDYEAPTRQFQAILEADFPKPL